MKGERYRGDGTGKRERERERKEEKGKEEKRRKKQRVRQAEKRGEIPESYFPNGKRSVRGRNVGQGVGKRK